MPDNNQSKPTENPVQEPQNNSNKPTTPIPPKPRPELIDIQTEGLRPDIEEKKNKK